MTTIYLIRHGQASFGSDDYDRLSPLGHEQSRVLGEALAKRLPEGAPVDVFTGTMRRHKETAAGCLAALGREHAPTVHAGFDEFDHEDVIACHAPQWRAPGAMLRELSAQPDPMAAFQAAFEVAMARWTGGAHDADYAESFPAFQLRCRAALDAVAAQTARGATALVFTSGGTISVLLQALLGLDTATLLQLEWRMANASVTKLAAGGRGARVVSINEHAHLECAGPGLLSFR